MFLSVEFATATVMSRRNRDGGASLVEWALLVMVIALVCLVAVRL